jgi:hypothetical protein
MKKIGPKRPQFGTQNLSKKYAKKKLKSTKKKQRIPQQKTVKEGDI